MNKSSNELKKNRSAHFPKHFYFNDHELSITLQIESGLHVLLVNVIYSHVSSVAKATLMSNSNHSRVFTVKPHRKDKIVIVIYAIHKIIVLKLILKLCNLSSKDFCRWLFFYET